MKNRSVSITGATGFVGWHLAEAFVRDGWLVRAIVRRGNTKPVPAGTTIVECDLTADALAKAFNGSHVVVHSAALIRARDEASFNAVNVEGSRAAAAASASIGAVLVLISSQAAGGSGTPHAPRLESDPPSPVNAYGRSKLAAEEAVKAVAGLRWSIVRPCAVYGPRDRGFLPLFRMARRGLFLVPSTAHAAFTLIHVADLTRAVILAAESDTARGETMFVGNSQPQTGQQVLEAIADAVGRPFRPQQVPTAVFAALAKFGDLSWRFGVRPLVDSGRLAELRGEGFVCSVERATTLLGFEAAIDLHEGMQATARWYREHGWI